MLGDWRARIYPNPNGQTLVFLQPRSAHNYLAVYDHLLPPLRGTPAVLEVGVKKGGSLVLWREYFSDKTSVFGVDVDRFGPTFPRDAGVKVLSLDSQVDGAWMLQLDARSLVESL